MYSKKYDIIHTEIIIFLDFKILKDTAITHVWIIQLIGAMVTTAAYLGLINFFTKSALLFLTKSDNLKHVTWYVFYIHVFINNWPFLQRMQFKQF